MKYKRIYATPDGESHIVDVEVPMLDEGALMFRSARQKAAALSFREMGVGFKRDWHVNPGRYFSFFIDGEFELTASDGTKYRPQPGDVYLVEDLTGKGHMGRNLGKRPVRSITVFLE
jgi:hypothetical protein